MPCCVPNTVSMALKCCYKLQRRKCPRHFAGTFTPVLCHSGVANQLVVLRAVERLKLLVVDISNTMHHQAITAGVAMLAVVAEGRTLLRLRQAEAGAVAHPLATLLMLLVALNSILVAVVAEDMLLCRLRMATAAVTLATADTRMRMRYPLLHYQLCHHMLQARMVLVRRQFQSQLVVSGQLQRSRRQQVAHLRLVLVGLHPRLNRLVCNHHQHLLLARLPLLHRSQVTVPQRRRPWFCMLRSAKAGPAFQRSQ